MSVIKAENLRHVYSAGTPFEKTAIEDGIYYSDKTNGKIGEGTYIIIKNGEGATVGSLSGFKATVKERFAIDDEAT